MSSAPDSEGDEWRFAVDEVGEDAEPSHEPEPIEPGSPSIENAAFVLVGMLLAVTLLLVTLGIVP